VDDDAGWPISAAFTAGASPFTSLRSDNHRATAKRPGMVDQRPIQARLRDLFRLRMNLHQPAAVEWTDVWPSTLIESQIPHGDALRAVG